jgi:alginate O-acetyltransferase complex protein AlgI
VEVLLTAIYIIRKYIGMEKDMSFTTFEFFLFIAAAVIIYYVIPKKLQWIWLLIISYVYYASYDISTVWMLLLTTYVTYRGGILLDRLNEQKPQDGISREEKKDFKKNIVRKKKKIVLAMVLIAFGMLGIMKYTNFMLGNIDAVLRLFGSGKQIGVLNLTLPLGISFYTFQSISYVVDVYRGKHKAQGNFFKHALFVSFFPQLLQGPIGRYERLGSQLYEGHSYNLKELQFGVQRILWGFFKKMVLADRVNAAVLLIFHNYWNYGGWYNVLGVLLYSIQLYADFSGGIDIVIGIAQMFGITMDENFRQPYFSRSISEFWRRWHITLGTWMKDYIFYPFSLSKSMAKFGKWSKKKFGNNVGKLLPVGLADILVFFVVGVWHGAAWKYIMYGIYNGVIVAGSGMLAPVYAKIQEKLHINPKKWWYQGFCIIRTFILVNIGFYFDMANDLRAANAMLVQTVTKAHISQLSMAAVKAVGLTSQDLLIVIAGCIIIFVVSLLKEKGINIRETIASYNIVIRWIIYIVFIMFILIYGSTSTTSDFIYANF